MLYLSLTDSIGTHFALLTHFLFWLYQGLALVRHITEHFFSSKVILTCNLLTPKGDYYLISPDNITLKSHIKVVRIRKQPAT